MKETKNPIKTVIDLNKNSRRKSHNHGIGTAGERYIDIKLDSQKAEKEKMALYIVNNYIKHLDAIAIDAGSTQQLIIEKMMERNNYLSIITNNMTAFRQNALQRASESSNEFILTGGKYVALFDALHGEETLSSFGTFNPNVVIIGVSGLVAEKGFLCHGNDEVKVKNLLFNKTLSTIIIPVVSKKLGRMDSYPFGKLADFNSTNEAKKVVVVCPPIPPISESKEEKESYQKERIVFDKEVDKIIKAGVFVEIVPDQIVDRIEFHES